MATALHSQAKGQVSRWLTGEGKIKCQYNEERKRKRERESEKERERDLTVLTSTYVHKGGYSDSTVIGLC